ncbi:hypothetical protein [Pseudomonas sp. MNR3A]|uniref:hypothetical protein n=1 Tax=Pseudomonas sp. MNR3A TaxID=2615213 RepID=UPI00129B94CC|nr:hypothetical protein [Pseudomonas sp. MNR3A]
MDIESFSQCIDYMQVNQVKMTVDKFIPVASALSGALMGFYLNYLSSSRKEGRASKNKLMCCGENVRQIQGSVVQLLLELCKLMECVAFKKKPARHNLPGSISSLYLNEYFSDVAHKFSKEQREWVQQLLTEVEIINKALPELWEKDVSSFYGHSLALLNLSSRAMTAWNKCENIVRGVYFDTTNKDLLELIGATNDQVYCYFALVENAEVTDEKLGLNKV